MELTGSQMLSKGMIIELLSTLEGRELVSHDEIKEAAIKHEVPKSCYTCRHLATHAGCGKIGTPQYCLSNQYHDEDYINHDFGNWRTDEAEMILDGRRNIVIGYQGEAEVNATRNMEDAYRHLCHVSEECGYLTTKSGNIITIYKDTGEHQLAYDEKGELQSVGRMVEGKFIPQWTRSGGEI